MKLNKMNSYIVKLAFKGLLCAFIFISAVQIVYSFYIQSIIRTDRYEDVKMLSHVIRTQFPSPSHPDELKKMESLLRDFTQRNIINAFRITLNNKIIGYHIIDSVNTVFDQVSPASRSIASVESNDPLDYEIGTFSNIQLGNPNDNVGVLIAFFKPSPWAVYLRDLQYQVYPLVLIFTGIFLTLIGFIVLGRKEFTLLFADLAAFEGRNLNQLKAQTEQGLGLRNFILKVTEQRKKLKEKVNTISHQMESGKLWAQEQIDQQRTQFNATFVRIDINGYAGIISSHSRMRNQFDVEFENWAKNICSRFNARIEKIIGDEFVLFFEENSDYDHHWMAFHFVRACFEELEIFNQKINTLGFNEITLKASLCDAPVQLIKNEDVVQIKSDALILTQRLLQGVSDKSQSSLILFHHQYLAFSSFAKSAQAFNLKFKESDHKSVEAVDVVVDFPHSVHLFLQKQWPYLRSQKDLVFLLLLAPEYMRNHELVAWLQKTNWQGVTNEVVSVYLDLLNRSSSQNPEILATVISLAKAIMPNSADKELVSRELEKFLNSSNDRVVANVRDALVLIAPQRVDIKKFVQSSNHRAAASSLVDYVKINGFDSWSFEQLKKWIQGSNDAFIVSGLFAINQIINYFLFAKPEQIDINPYLQKSLELITPFSRGEHVKQKEWAKRSINLLKKL